MANMSLKRNEMPCQDPMVRSTNFDEVTLGYTAEQAIDEAKRCLNCKNKPCVSGCPVKVHIPEFIAKVAEGEFETHKYLNAVKGGNDEQFRADFEQFAEKYQLA